MKNVLTSAIVALTVSCANWPMAADEENLEAQIAARQGEQVDRICFTRSIDGWRELGDEAILIEKGVNDWYKLDLTGTCQPDQAFNAIAIRTRPAASMCLTEGDSIETFDTPIEGTCFIAAMYEWDEEAVVADVAADDD